MSQQWWHMSVSPAARRPNEERRGSAWTMWHPVSTRNKSIDRSSLVHKVHLRSYQLFYLILSMPIQLENRIKFFHFQFSNELSFQTESVRATGGVELSEARDMYCSKTLASHSMISVPPGSWGLSLWMFTSQYAFAECSIHHPGIYCDWHLVGLLDGQVNFVHQPRLGDLEGENKTIAVAIPVVVGGGH